MNEERVLLYIADTGDGVQVKFHTSSMEDIYSVSTAIAQLLVDKPLLGVGVVTLAKQLVTDENYRKAVEDATVDISKFDDILKNG